MTNPNPSIVANEHYSSGTVVGTGAAINVSCGFIPSRVELMNVTDGNLLTVAFLRGRIPFTSGAVATPVTNEKATGGTSGAIVHVQDVILKSGTFAGGNAAGTFLADVDDMVGTLTSETLTGASSGFTATVTAMVPYAYKVDSGGPATVTGNSAMSAYVGSSTASKGFTIGSSISTSAKELRWVAWR